MFRVRFLQSAPLAAYGSGGELPPALHELWTESVQRVDRFLAMSILAAGGLCVCVCPLMMIANRGLDDRLVIVFMLFDLWIESVQRLVSGS